MENYLEVSRYGKPVGVFFDSKFENITVRDGKEEIPINDEDKAALRDLIEQEVYLSIMSLEAMGSIRNA